MARCKKKWWSLTEAVTEARIPVTGGAVRAVEINQDHAALAHFERAR